MSLPTTSTTYVPITYVPITYYVPTTYNIPITYYVPIVPAIPIVTPQAPAVVPSVPGAGTERSAGAALQKKARKEPRPKNKSAKARHEEARYPHYGGYSWKDESGRARELNSWARKMSRTTHTPAMNDGIPAVEAARVGTVQDAGDGLTWRRKITMDPAVGTEGGDDASKGTSWWDRLMGR